MARVTVSVRVKDMERTRLSVWELTMLVDRMRVAANPEARTLEQIVERYSRGGDDDRPSGREAME